MDMQVSPSLGTESVGCVPRIGTAGSYNSSISRLLRKIRTGFQTGRTPIVSPTFAIAYISDFGHSDWSEM